MINLVKNAVKIFKENLIFSFRSKYLKYKLKVSGNSKKLSQLQLHTIKVIVIVILIEKTITITLLTISALGDASKLTGFGNFNAYYRRRKVWTS